MQELIDEDPSLQIKRKNPPIFRKDRHLSTALLTSEIDYFLKK